MSRSSNKDASRVTISKYCVYAKKAKTNMN